MGEAYEKHLNHFKIWELEEHKFLDPDMPHDRISVLLEDQFHEKHRALSAVVNRISWIACPVEKTVIKPGGKKEKHNINDPPNDLWHLSGYSIIPQKTDRHEVWVSNQFQQWPKWVLVGPEYLLVPASKEIKPGIPGKIPKNNRNRWLDHFLCYKVENPSPVNTNITLEDQIDTFLGRLEMRLPEEHVKSLTPAFLGVPTKKDSGEKTHSTHLAIYKIDPPETIAKRHQIKISVRDQLTEKWVKKQIWADLVVKQSLYLAVPTEKSVTEPPVAGRTPNNG